MIIDKNEFLHREISKLKGVGNKIRKYLANKKIEKIKDLLWDLPYAYDDRSKITGLDKLEIGKITTVKIKVLKYNFPRVRNLPNKVICEQNKTKINIIFFNSYEGYIRKILPLGEEVIVSGKINYFKKSYQIINPKYVNLLSKKNEVAKKFPKYSLTEGLNEKVYRNLIKDVLNKLDDSFDWYTNDFLKNNNFNNFKETFVNLHNPLKKNDIFSNDYRRLVYDEVLANLLTLYSARKAVRSKKKIKKVFSSIIADKVIKNFPYSLNKKQKQILNEINNDIKSDNRMFRLLQGDVGSGKTILAIAAAANVIEAKYQVALMAPTEILAYQHYDLAKKLFKNTNLKIRLLTSKIDRKIKKEILFDCKNNKINFLIGTHSLFQKNIKFKKLGFIIIDEQHKFGVKQRILLAKKGGDNCDVLAISATPIPRTMMLSTFGDMDISILNEKPKDRLDIITLVKPENKINDVLPLIKKQMSLSNQIFWVCPLIEESKKLKFSSAIQKYNLIKKIFPNQTGLIHGKMNKIEKDQLINNFEKNKIKILVSTTVIEVGINFPNANIMIIENANKFGLSQLHQLRGRVGRGDKESYCILLYNKNLSENAKKRLRILKNTNDGFKIAEEDLKLRSFGDLLGYQQSGVKNFKFADPIHHKDLFFIANDFIKNLDTNDFKKYKTLIKLFDKAEVIDEIKN